jgi:putative membrane protein (TIGR04086 family)
MRLEGRAIVPGAAVGILTIAVAVLVSRLTNVVGDDDRTFLVLPLVEVGIIGLFSGGWVAALRCRRAPLVHGAAAALAAVGACCAAAVVGRLAGGNDVPWASALVWLLLALAAGTAGGLMSLRPRRRADSPG